MFLKSFHLTLWTILLFFLTILGVVGYVALHRPSNSTGHDPALLSHQEKK